EAARAEVPLANAQTASRRTSDDGRRTTDPACHWTFDLALGGSAGDLFHDMWNRYLIALVIVAVVGAAVIYLLAGREPIVVDDAALLSGSQKAFLTEYHSYLQKDHGIDYRVVTTTSSDPILEHAVDLYDELKVGSKSDWGRGLLLVINPKQDMVRLEVGYALEATYPDAFVGYIERDQMVPFFADGRVADGILATTELIVDRAQRADSVGADETWMMGSGGGGAEMEARLGRDAASPPDTTAERAVSPAASPNEALAAYLSAMGSRNTNPHLTIYSPATQAMMKDRTVTPAQMDNVVRTARECTSDTLRYDASSTLAVIRYPPAQRKCSPWFFVKVDDHWTLDLASMSRAIRFGRTNAWHRSKKGFGHYAFAFDDWTFDENGFPF
ncbi:MAG: TPM domain-containing protein, partial [Rhodothermales bacterium]